MLVEKFGGAAGNNPGSIAHYLALVSRESVITPVLTVDGAYSAQVASLLQLLSATGKAKDKSQAMYML